MRREVEEVLVNFFEGEKDVLVSYIFGSHVRGYATRESDFDIAVLLSETPRSLLECYLYLINKLTEILGDNVDLVILNTAPPMLKYHVVRYGRVIYSRSERARVTFEARAVSEYLDFSIDMKRYDECLMKREQE
ncbi:MAG: nucleotidyltransferase domain-containing protein [Candidatus Bathyarchaeia archaeon]